MLNQFMKESVIHVANVIIKQHLQVTLGNMLNQFMKVYGILVINVITKLLRKDTLRDI